MRRVYRRKRPFEYLLPFFIFVGVGVIGVLGFQLWNNFQGAKGDVFFYIASGKAKLLQYGTKEWENAYSGTKLLLGDGVKTTAGGRGVLEFFNGTKVRLNEDTEVTLTDITKRNDVEKIGLTLTHGSIWINKVKTEDVDQSDLEVRTNHLLVTDVGTTFEVESNGTETVRLMKGNVNVQIMADDNGKSTVLDTVQVGVGQEMTLDDAILKAFQNHKNPSVLMALNDTFKLSDWYLWNVREDENPTDFKLSQNLDSSGFSQQYSLVGTQQSVFNTSSTQQTVVTPPPATPDAGIQPPVIDQPSPAVMSTDKNKMTMSGTVSAGTAKIIVNETIGGSTDNYTLSKFKSGDTQFSYNVSEALGNYKPGENIYRFIAVDTQGNKSESSDVHITYTKAAAQITDALSAPKVLTYNGSSSASANTVTVGVVKINGSVAGAEKVFVNGYQLSKFVAGDKTWTYFANEQGGNLNPGVNNYEIYAVDPQGNKSETVKFTITYNKPAGSTTQASGSTATSTPPPAPTPTPTPGTTQDVPQGF